MNDVPEPLMIDQDFGGVGVDYHGVTQSWRQLVGDQEKRIELFSVCAMATQPADDPKFKPVWDAVLGSLEEMRYGRPHHSQGHSPESPRSAPAWRTGYPPRESRGS